MCVSMHKLTHILGCVCVCVYVCPKGNTRNCNIVVSRKGKLSGYGRQNWKDILPFTENHFFNFEFCNIYYDFKNKI